MKKKQFLTVKEVVLFGLFPAIMVAAQQSMAALPNIHLTGMFVMLTTLIFRVKALIPLYIYVFVMGILLGFNVAWLPYLYIWTVLWGMTMLIPKNIPTKVAIFVYPAVCALHGFGYGILYAPTQALVYGYSWEQTKLWILSGLPFDALHGISNLCMGMLIVPLLKALQAFPDGKKS